MEGKLFVDVALTGGRRSRTTSASSASCRTRGASPSSASSSHSGVDDFPHVDEGVLRRAMPILADAGVPLLVHAELAGPIDEALRRQGNLSDAELTRYVHWLESRPREAENAAVDLVVRLARATGRRAPTSCTCRRPTRSRRSALARDAGARVSAETCPHYLVFAAEDVPDGATEYKCAPPIRERHNRERLWQALARGRRLAGRDGSLAVAGRPQVHRHGGLHARLGRHRVARARASRRRGPRRARAGSSMARVVEWMCAAPGASRRARRPQGQHRGRARTRTSSCGIRTASASSTPPRMHQRHKLTPYARRTLSGVVHATYLRGRKVYAAGAHVGASERSLRASRTRMTPDFTELVDLAAERLGGAALWANDEFFAEKDNLLKAEPAVFVAGKYTDRGKWMDGWETRRRRTPGHDWCIVRLGVPGVVRGVVVDTSHFKGNFPEAFSLEACSAPAQAPLDELEGAALARALAAHRPARATRATRSPSTRAWRATHVRLRIYPDGGVARLRVHGEAIARSAMARPRRASSRTWTSRPSRTAASWSRRATPSSGRGTRSSCPAARTT